MAGAPLKIFEIPTGSATVTIDKGNLQQLERNLKNSGAGVVSIVSVMGSYRTGKSFLLDLMIRYMKHKRENPAPSGTGDSDWTFSFSEEATPESQLPTWMSQGDIKKISEGSKGGQCPGGFAWRPGQERCTQGIWIWSEPFVFKNEKTGKKVAVLLMDTQGAGDNDLAKDQSAMIFGLTALVSSKLIFNIQNKVEDHHIDHMDYITTFAKTVLNDRFKGAPYGHLELLVRDWPNFQEGDTEEECRRQMKQHQARYTDETKVPDDAKAKTVRLKGCFRDIGCSGLPFPNRSVQKKDYDGDVSKICGDFWHLCDRFFEDFFSGDFPQASSPLGSDITTNSFAKIITNYADAFKTEGAGRAIDLRDAFVRVRMSESKEEIESDFRTEFEKFAPEGSVVDPEELDVKLARLMGGSLESFENALQPFELPKEDLQSKIDAFREALDSYARARVKANQDQVSGANAKILASPIIGCFAYGLLVHTWVLAVVAGAAAWWEAKSVAARSGTEVFDFQVFNGFVEDVTKVLTNIHRDIQAIFVALGRLTPQSAMETVRNTANQGVAALAGARAASTNEASTSNGALNGASH